MTDSSLTRGGCLCGSVRYVARGNPRLVAFCHCPSCRRSLAAPITAWALYDRSAFEFDKGEPRRYSSSPGVERTFCGQCGTSLTYTSESFGDLVDVTVGSLDDPGAMAPQFHIWASTSLPWLHVDDGLPRHAEFPPLARQ